MSAGGNGKRHLSQESARTADRCVMTVFGASGDLTKRKLLPAIYNLGRNNLLPREFAILGFAKDVFTEEDFRKTIRAELKEYVVKENRENWKIGLFLNKMLMKYTYARARPRALIVVDLYFSLDFSF